jgi:hypothetical protein
MDSLLLDLIAARPLSRSHNTGNLKRSLDPLQHRPPPQHLRHLKQRRRSLAPADGNPNGLKHLSRLHSEFLCGGAPGLIERVVLELESHHILGKDLKRVPKTEKLFADLCGMKIAGSGSYQ